MSYPFTAPAKKGVFILDKFSFFSIFSIFLLSFFCKIIAGQIPAVKVLDEELVLAFMDINPASRDHVLVIPKKHAENIFEVSSMHSQRQCALPLLTQISPESVLV